MAAQLKVTELDFDTIKANLKAFLRQQSEFTDYDFDGAGLTILLDLLAYNTHYNAYYLNMVSQSRSGVIVAVGDLLECGV